MRARGRKGAGWEEDLTRCPAGGPPSRLFGCGGPAVSDWGLGCPAVSTRVHRPCLFSPPPQVADQGQLQRRLQRRCAKRGRSGVTGRAAEQVDSGEEAAGSRARALRYRAAGGGSWRRSLRQNPSEGTGRGLAVTHSYPPPSFPNILLSTPPTHTRARARTHTL